MTDADPPGLFLRPLNRAQQPANPGLTGGLPRVVEAYPPGASGSNGSGCPGDGSLAAFRTIVMIPCKISPRTPSAVPRSKYLTAARIVALASSAPANSESSKSDMNAPIDRDHFKQVN